MYISDDLYQVIHGLKEVLFLGVNTADLHVAKCDMNYRISKRLIIDINLKANVLSICFDR